MSNLIEDESCNVHLHAEIELLKKALADKQAELSIMKSACYQESDRQVELEDSVLAWQDKFERLYESHKRVQKINQNLEDKLLKLVDRNSGERAQLTSDCATLTIRLNQANYNILGLQKEIERYKQDINLAIQLLQCNPESFIPQKIALLPIEMQSKISSYIKHENNSHSDSEGSVGNSTRAHYHIVPSNDDAPSGLCPFPPTAMVHSMRGVDQHESQSIKNGDTYTVSPSIVAKFLEDELKTRKFKHCNTCACVTNELTVMPIIHKWNNVSTQTEIKTMQCLRCDSNMNSPSHTNSPFFIKIKSSDSVISETKSSVSAVDSLGIDKNFTPKKDDLVVNPILGHHRLCERTKMYNNQQKHPLKNDLCLPSNVSSDENQKLFFSNRSEAIGNSPLMPTSLEHSNISKDCKISNDEQMTGSTNSIWSRASSKEGAKMFESFNRNLIKTIKAENPKMNGPRICALKLAQDGSNNILLNNIQGENKQIIYKRRPRLLDEELDDEKDITTACNLPINITSSQSSIMMSTNSNQSNAINDDDIFSTNKTDSEKFNEIHLNNVPKIEKHDILVQRENPFIAISDAEKNSTGISKEIVVHENVLLRRQQLNRVAEWVQNSTNLSTLPETANVEPSNIPLSLYANLDSVNMQSDITNNNSSVSYTNDIDCNQMYKNELPLIMTRESQHNSIAENDEEVESIKTERNENHIDIAQMEYNVKQFLLKQNEWSINRSITSDNQMAVSSEATEDRKSIRNPQRTETNL